jgi:DNA (cytosine-5)-methyltransferase 1
MTLGSLFSGIGGFDLAAEWCGITVSWVSEIDPYASAVLKKHFPNAPNLGDITTLTNPPPVDILCGGFPCQDISTAGSGKGVTGERSGLWKHYARIVGEVRPEYVIIENSPNLRNKGLEVVLQDLWALGYDAEWHCIPASSVGAPHQRDRIWIVAYPMRQRQQGPWALGDARDSAAQAEGKATHVVNGGIRQQGQWLLEPNVGRVAHGVPSRMDRLKCLGNAIVPQVAEIIFRSILDDPR